MPKVPRLAAEHVSVAELRDRQGIPGNRAAESVPRLRIAETECRVVHPESPCILEVLICIPGRRYRTHSVIIGVRPVRIKRERLRHQIPLLESVPIEEGGKIRPIERLESESAINAVISENTRGIAATRASEQNHQGRHRDQRFSHVGNRLSECMTARPGTRRSRFVHHRARKFTQRRSAVLCP